MKPTDSPLMIAHRGASAYLPENTLEAFRLAFEKFKADMIEFDVRITEDGIPVVIHDAKVDRTTNGEGYVSQKSCQELQKLDAGYFFDPNHLGKFPERGKGIKIPSLEEVLSGFPNHSFAIEIKDKSEELTHSVVALLKKYNVWQNAVVGSKYFSVSRVMQQHYPHIRRFCSQREILSLWTKYHLRKRNPTKDPMAVASMPMRFFGMRFDTRKWIEFLHAKGMAVYFWAYQNPRAILSLQRKGADGLVLDDPMLIQGLGRS
jgi:glycerophosphoryl diester phosphodiesterase